MLDREINNTENNVSEMVKMFNGDNPYCLKPSVFYEQYLGIKLLGYQKKLLDMRYKCTAFIQTRDPNKRFSTYLMLIAAYMNMKEDGTIAIVNYPDNVRILNKKEFGIWLAGYR